MKRWTVCLLLTLPAAAKTPPYQAAGLNSYQASAHLLSRLSYGASPGQVEAVARQGLDVWLDGQLSGRSPDAACEQRLQAYPAVRMSFDELSSHFVTGPQLRQLARQSGMREGDVDKKEARQQATRLIRAQGREPERALLRQLLAQKTLRALHTEHQLREVMTDFWFNHFNVSRTNNAARPFLLSYERDAIRPHALGSFRELLGATARHPAMLLYLNNAQSMAPLDAARLSQPPFRLPQNARRQPGLNENYARELMELHTLGVDGGYTQKDVTEVARILSGWTTMPKGAGQSARFERLLEEKPGALQAGPYGFLFAPFLHDAGSKNVLGSAFPAGHGLDEGERLLDLLAAHDKTSRRIAHKFAVRFVSEDPDPRLVHDLAAAFRRSHGNSAVLLKTLVDSPHFWAPAALRAKVKNPAEYTFSSIRALGGELSGHESDLPRWLEKMGQSPYGCVPPTGYPDRSEQWISSGTLVHRMNFAFALASNKIAGVRVELPRGDVQQIATRLLPGRDLRQALAPVRQTLGNPKFFADLQADQQPLKLTEQEKTVGVLISCPEFQRR
jgi:uncharacterized protein (DUF1800 family)